MDCRWRPLARPVNREIPTEPAAPRHVSPQARDASTSMIETASVSAVRGDKNMLKFKEIDVALNELAALERKLKNPGGPVEDVFAGYAVRVAIASIEAVQQLAVRQEAAAN
jgi:hypothetical protein